jgi:hypothetical protein
MARLHSETGPVGNCTPAWLGHSASNMPDDVPSPFALEQGSPENENPPTEANGIILMSVFDPKQSQKRR